MQVRIRDIELADTVMMAMNMRPMDRLEFSLMSGGRPAQESLEKAMDMSLVARAGFVNDKLVALWGVTAVPITSRIGVPWACATRLVDEDYSARRAFLENTPTELVDLCKGFKSLWNVVLEENRLARRWLTWTGFHFTGETSNIDGHKFLYFEKGC